MKDKEKSKILKFLSEYSNLNTSSAAKLQLYLVSKGCNPISLPTINKYKKILIYKMRNYDNKIGFKTNNYDEIINEIIDELNRNRNKINKSRPYRDSIHNSLLNSEKKYKSELIKNKNNFYTYNKILKNIKGEVCSSLKHIPEKTLNYLYNDEAKKLNLLPKRSSIDKEIINKIETLFLDGTMYEYIKNCDTSNTTPQNIQNYIEKHFKIILSTSQINYYFFKYYKYWWMVDVFL